jgi:pimeloyl-ACP methyl ester carboxylesterase
MAKLTLDWRERRVDIEYQWVNTNQVDTNAPVMVFLHEGLGSVALWKDFPQQLCAQLGMRGLIYSRPGYGKSTPRAREEHWAPDFMHRQAHEVLPMLLEALGIDTPWLFGHSDGGSIALLFAAKFPLVPSGVIVVAPHLFVEQISIDSIKIARQAYLQGDLRERLARYHDDVDSAFFGWNDAWLSPAFSSWNIEASIPDIRCRVLAIQGEQDEYGSLQQIHRIQALQPSAAAVSLPNCGHSPHRDQPDFLMRVVADFIQQTD